MAEPRSEPSMEDILASIKRIIADEPAQGGQGRAPSPAAPASPLQPATARTPSVLQQRTQAEPPPPWPTRPQPRVEPKPPESILELTDRMPEPAPQRAPAPSPAEPPEPVQRAMERLRQAEAEMPQPAAPRPVPRDLLPRTPAPRPTGGDVTLDALVREMLQPILADWIERNLPDMVERLVQAEIRRMSDKDG